MAKHYKLTAKQIAPLAEGFGGCIATDLITVDGKRVNFMYREATDREHDSGWRFMSGFESDEYMNEPTNHGIYDVNTIANYDQDIIPFLGAPVGSAYERNQHNGAFEAVEFGPPED
ncbi:hypothetical protein KOR34_42860 [Posidoniimonas corsicana]|uniref:Immunity protein Imm33 domain-containing protein n=1 Tax=Posidoniimonas corsicana TaxID=1938618 RepID=A0A5C5V3J7_9BACT|nr:DUF2185 domain-containing protein [Posidoniimonas corsicana]TWT32523.1 hypothetical protein KOR34_42860 [Posidoniimonas corsicana]